MANPPLPPPPPTDWARMPSDISPKVAMLAALLTVTSRPLPPPTPWPPTVLTALLPFELVKPAPIAKPPLPPPPPTDWARMPVALSPTVEMNEPASVVTCTLPPSPAAPPWPPVLLVAESPPMPRARPPAKPPLPPPPPIDCAKMPTEPCPPVAPITIGPNRIGVPVMMPPPLLTVTLPALPPPAPLPPVALASAAPLVEREPAIANAPLPPPPPIDWASMPSDKSCRVIIMLAELATKFELTMTSPAELPTPPAPPTVCSLVLLSEIVPAKPMAKPPLPPPPPIDWAIIAAALRPPV